MSKDPSTKAIVTEGIVAEAIDGAVLIGQAVVLDLSSPYVVLGTVRRWSTVYVELADADVHDLRDSKTTRELYVLEAKRHGIRSNRQTVWLRCEEIVSWSRLADVIS